MQIVIPMAGQGERFKRAGYQTIKPLIEIGGKPMIEYVVNFFPDEEDFLFICDREHLATTELEAVLKRLKPKGKVVGIPYQKEGPVYAILQAATDIKNGEPIIVNYCDFDMIWDYGNFKHTMSERNAASAAVCYTGFHPHLEGPNVYAGVRSDENLRALEVREKHSFTEDKTKSWHQAGSFYFQSGALLKKYARATYDAGIRTNGECYVSNLFNAMIADGLLSLVYPVSYFCQWGTPEDLAAYERDIAEARELAAANHASPTPTLAYWRRFLDKRNAIEV